MTMPFAQRVIDAMNAKGWSARKLSDLSGVSYGVISKLKQRPNSSTSAENAEKLAAVLWPDGSAEQQASPEDVPDGWGDFGGSEQPRLHADLIPVFNVQASAGYGALIEHEEIVDRLAFPPGYLRRLTKADPRNLAIIGVKGESMVPTLQDDDIVMLDLSKKDLSYDGLFVIRDDGDGLLVKRIGRASQRGYVMMIPDNKAYPTVERPADQVEVIGRVIWMGKKV